MLDPEFNSMVCADGVQLYYKNRRRTTTLSITLPVPNFT